MNSLNIENTLFYACVFMARPLPHRTKTRSQLLNLSAAPQCVLFGRTPEALSDVSRQKLTKGPRGTTGKRLTAKDSEHEKPLWGEDDKKGEKDRYTSHLRIASAPDTRDQWRMWNCYWHTKSDSSRERNTFLLLSQNISLPTAGKTVTVSVCVCVSDRNFGILTAAESESTLYS